MVSRWAKVISKDKPKVWATVEGNEGLFKTVLQAVRLMHLCEYHCLWNDWLEANRSDQCIPALPLRQQSFDFFCNLDA